MKQLKQLTQQYFQINSNGEYNFSIYIFKRILAVIYLISFLSFGLQAKGLIGAKGVLPAKTFFQALKSNLNSLQLLLYKPSIFLLSSSEVMIKLVPILGILVSLLLLFRFKERLMLIILYILYLSIVIAGQQFMAFQWDNLLLEAGFLAIFLSPNSSLAIWLFRWLLFRLMFASGFVKLASGNDLWWSLEALKHHYLTQPLPTVFAWYMDKLPIWVHKLSAGVMFFIELVIPFFYFFKNKLRLVAAVATVFLMSVITITGNYTMFTILTASLAIFLVKNKEWKQLISDKWIKEKNQSQTKALESTKKYILPASIIVLLILSTIVFTTQLGFSWPQFVQEATRVTRSYRITNSYGLFANMTNPRYEIIIQGSKDGKNWKTYEFRYKPGKLSEAPVWVQPHQPRVDWQMWFAALSNAQRQRWFQSFVVKLLQGSKPVANLLEKNPFPINPPKYIRAIRYKYEFTSFKEKKKTGNWWKRERVGYYLPPVSLSDFKNQ
ncbi:MAG: lipase maturation factor family protein [Candidatus Magasanikbacteria bacterium]